MALRLFHIARAIECTARTELPEGALLAWLRLDVPVTAAPSRDPRDFWRLKVARRKHGLRGFLDRLIHRAKRKPRHRIRLEWRAGRLTGQVLPGTASKHSKQGRT